MKSFNHAFIVLFSFAVQSLHSSQSSSSTTSGSEEPREESGGSNETEITILINSSFMIIEELEINNATDLDRVAESSIGKRYKSLPRPAPSLCRKFSVSEKYRLLEGIGARNQFYMAETPDEASLGFVQPSPSPIPKAKSFADNVDEVSVTPARNRISSAFTSNDGVTDGPPFCNEECQLIKKKLEDALEKRRQAKPLVRLPQRLFQDTGPKEVDEGFGRINRGCALETFVPLGNCSDLGDEVSWDHEQLCSMCRGVYMLSENCFPTFFNSVVCNKQETGCIFDNFSNRAHGICRSETLSLRVLRNRGDAECEDWGIEHLELPVACQCLLSKDSWLRSRPPKEL